MQLHARVLVLVVVTVLMFSSYAYYMNYEHGQNTASFGQHVNEYSVTTVKNYDTTIMVNYSQLSYAILRSLGLEFHIYGQYLILSGLSGRQFSEITGVLGAYGIGFMSIPENLTATPYLNATPMQQSSGLVYYPHQIYQAYDYSSAFLNGIMGKGETIGIVDAFGDPYLNYDVFAFDQLTGLPPVNLSVIYLNFTGFSVNSHWVEETSLDVEWAHASAPYARIVLVISNNDTVSSLTSALNYMINNIRPDVISLSWGIAENQVAKPDLIAMDAIYQEASQEGITIVAASGDNGAYDGTGNLTVNFPASSPYVLSVGGVSLFAFNGKFSESAWGGISDGKSYGSGGGYSSVFTRPVWQDPENYSSAFRGVPDVSMVANPNTGVLMISGAKAYDAGGTSLAAPLWAGIVALMDQASKRSLGHVDPLLYQISNTRFYQNAFTQVTSGSNGYYNASPGWNPVTGLGTPIVSNLINDTNYIMDPYGSMYLFNTTPDSVSASFTVMEGNSTYSYIGFYQNSSSYILFGIMNLTGYSNAVIMVSENGITLQQNVSMANGRISDLSISALSTYEINVTYNGKSYDLTAFFFNMGLMRPVAGVEVVNSMDNLSSPVVYIHDLMIDGRGYSNFSATQIRYSGIGPAYDSIGMDVLNNGSLMAARSSSFIPNPIKGTVSLPYIQYQIKLGAPMLISLYLNDSYNAVFYHDGYPVRQPLETYGGTTMEFNTTYSGSNITINVTVPRVYDMNITFIKNYGYSPVSAAILVDHFYSYIVANGTSIPVMAGPTEFTIESKEFNTFNGQIDMESNKTVNVPMDPYNATVQITVYPASANVTISGRILSEADGQYTGIFHPGTYTINVTMPGFRNYSQIITLTPGKVYRNQVILNPTVPMLRIAGNVTDGLFKFPIPDVLVNANETYAYTNATGNFFVYAGSDRGNVSFSDPLYHGVVVNYTGSPGETLYLNIDLYPANVSVLSIFVPRIANVFPFLFYITYISWNTYTGSNFGVYEILISNSRSMSNPQKLIITDQSQNSLFIMGTTPGHSYYIQEVLMLNTGQFFQSQVTVMSYSNPVYLGLNLVIVAAILIYIYFAISIFVRRRREY
ncbi:S8 family serine peptidase [Thermoplasma sp.]|uniref:S8 family serine peptidase n=1 Tax=Thermoplasma sp. TaxID=1973142 RepID=UPI00126CB40E|nr:S8 family serine peptidase [Thermoplasma sp.]KAA8923210.1 MAG: S8 family serine peptidase [Thermoplasma sp.]